MNNFYRYGTERSNELYHYGVKGMKWGVVNKVSKGVSDSSNRASSVVDSITNISKTSSAKKIDISKMSDQELQKRLNRMNMEKSYKSLIAEKRTSRGATYAKEALSVIGNVAAIGASVAGIITAIKKGQIVY